MLTFTQFLEEIDDKPVRIKLGQKPSGEKAKAFLKDFHDDSQEHPFHHSARIFHGVVIHMSRDGNEVHIHDIQSIAPKSGAGTKALKYLTKLADKHHVKLNLFAKAYSGRQEHIHSNERLMSWYEKHGFHHEDQDYDERDGSDMKYYPK